MKELRIDPRLNSEFFAEQKTSSPMTLNFSVPSTKPLLLKEFLKKGIIAKSNGDKFRKGTRILIDKIVAWALHNGFSTEQIEEINHFYNSYLQYQGRGEDTVNVTYVPLLTQGVYFLSAIAEQLSNEVIPIQTRKDTLKNLLSGLRVCAPGVFTNISDAYLRLSNNVLIEARRDIAVQTILELLADNIKSKKIPEGMEIHYANAVINNFSSGLAIAAIEDDYIKLCDTDICVDLIMQFPEKVSANLTLEKIFDYFLNKFNLNIHSSTEFEELEQQLDVLGNDKFYLRSNFLKLSDNSDNQAYQVIPIGLDYLRLTLQQRLAKNFKINFNSYHFHGLKDGNKICTTVFIPEEKTSLNFSYVDESIVTMVEFSRSITTGYELLGLEISNVERLPESFKNSGKPILVKQNENYFIWGATRNGWKMTSINDPSLSNIIFSSAPHAIQVNEVIYKKIAAKNAHLTYEKINTVNSEIKKIPFIAYYLYALEKKENDPFLLTFLKALLSQKQKIELADELFRIFKLEAIKFSHMSDWCENFIYKINASLDFFKKYGNDKTLLELANNLRPEMVTQLFSVLEKNIKNIKFSTPTEVADFIMLNAKEQHGDLIKMALSLPIFNSGIKPYMFIRKFFSRLTSDYLSQTTEKQKIDWIENFYLLLRNKKINFIFKNNCLFDLADKFPEPQREVISDILQLEISSIVVFAHFDKDLLVKFLRICHPKDRLNHIKILAGEKNAFLLSAINDPDIFSQILLLITDHEYSEFLNILLRNYNFNNTKDFIKSADNLFYILNQLNGNQYRTLLTALGKDDIKSVYSPLLLALNYSDISIRRLRGYDNLLSTYNSKLFGSLILVNNNLIVFKPEFYQTKIIIGDANNIQLSKTMILPGQAKHIFPITDKNQFALIIHDDNKRYSINIYSENGQPIGKPINIPDIPITFNNIAISSNGKCLLFDEKNIYFLADPNQAKWFNMPIKSLNLKSFNEIRNIKILKKGNIAISTYTNKFIILNDTLKQIYQNQNISCTSLLESPNGKYFVISGDNGMNLCTMMPDGRLFKAKIIDAATCEAGYMAWLLDGKLVYIGKEGIKSFDPISSEVSIIFDFLPSTEKSDISSLAVTADGHINFVLGRDFYNINMHQKPLFKLNETKEEKESKFQEIKFASIPEILQEKALKLYYGAKEQKDAWSEALADNMKLLVNMTDQSVTEQQTLVKEHIQKADHQMQSIEYLNKFFHDNYTPQECVSKIKEKFPTLIGKIKSLSLWAITDPFMAFFQEVNKIDPQKLKLTSGINQNL